MEERGGGRSLRDRPRSFVANADGINGNLTPASSTSSLSELDNANTDSDNNDVRQRRRPASRSGLGGGASGTDDESDQEILELSKLRCSGERTEVAQERVLRRNRCADYPGLAFGSSIFSSNTMMKLSVIKNELHNIMSVQLKRVRIFTSYFVSGKLSMCFAYQYVARAMPRATDRVNRLTVTSHPIKVTLVGSLIDLTV